MLDGLVCVFVCACVAAPNKHQPFQPHPLPDESTVYAAQLTICEKCQPKALQQHVQQHTTFQQSPDTSRNLVSNLDGQYIIRPYSSMPTSPTVSQIHLLVSIHRMGESPRVLYELARGAMAKFGKKQGFNMNSTYSYRRRTVEALGHTTPLIGVASALQTRHVDTKSQSRSDPTTLQV